jgi:hypothetical protein
MNEIFFEPKWIPQPQDNDSIWHYTNLDVYSSILQTKKLRFTSIEKWKSEQENTGEATFSPNFYKRNESQYSWLDSPAAELLEDRRIEMAKQIKKIEKQIFCSSWHINSSGSKSMWDGFSGSSEGIVIQTTYRNLKAKFKESICSFQLSDNLLSAMIGNVQYPDDNIADKESFIEKVNGNLDIFFLIYNPEFKHEKELRLLLYFNSLHPARNHYDLNINSLASLPKAIYCKTSAKNKLDKLHLEQNLLTPVKITTI